MFGRRRRKDNDLIGPSTGAIKWLNKFCRFILYPFIHPVWFLVGVVVLAGVAVGWPIYNGIEFDRLPQWYKHQFSQYYQMAHQEVSRVLPKTEMFEGTSGIHGRGINVMTVERQPGKAELVAYETPQMVNRKAFERAQDVPVDVAATLQRPKIEENGVPVFKRNEALGLRYLETPKKVTGRVKVVNANELKIDDNLFFLYGIYVSPYSKEGFDALNYLQQNIEGRIVDCFVGAYTATGAATAICVYGNLNINQRLVDLKYSKDVSLN